jgi:hypothetical protein
MRTKFIAALAVIALFTSCQKDFSEEYGTQQQTNNTITTNANALGANNCKASPYFPVCTGSVYNYTETRGAIAPGNELGAPNNYTLQYIGDTTIENKIYQKIKSYGTIVVFYNSTDAVLSQIVLNENTQTNGSVPYYKFTLVKSNASVGATWRDVLSLPANQTETNDYTIIAKGITKTVFGITYNDVIHIRQDVRYSASGSAVYSHTDKYMAKGIGVIESITYDDFNGGYVLSHRKLVSASIPQ